MHVTTHTVQANSSMSLYVFGEPSTSSLCHSFFAIGLKLPISEDKTSFINVTTCSWIVSFVSSFLINYCLHHVAIMSVLFSVPIWSLGPTGPPLSAAT